jgi:hypothetical protein
MEEGRIAPHLIHNEDKLSFGARQTDHRARVPIYQDRRR